MTEQVDPWKSLFSSLQNAPTASPRGMMTKEIMPYLFLSENPRADRWCTFAPRRLNVPYACLEFLWYLKADPDDLSITEYAKIWRELAAEGILQSNYGVYIFGAGQLQRCVDELSANPESRRAAIMILRPYHFDRGSNDIPCTLALTFFIREMKLHMHVHMRSSDAVFGMGNDVPCFTWTQELMLNLLKKRFPTLNMGRYCHMSDSMHVYERHFMMVNDICETPHDRSPVGEPRICGSKEAQWVIDNADLMWSTPELIPEGYRWATWLAQQAKTLIDANKERPLER